MHTLNLIALAGALAGGAVAVVGVDADGVAPVAGPEESRRCLEVDESTAHPVAGVRLTWSSSFACRDVSDRGSYTIGVTVSNDAGSAEAVRLGRLRLSHTTPRPRGRAPAGTASAAGLPVVIAPGQSKTFTVTGSYTLARTDEGRKANHHLRAFGHGTRSSDPLRLGLNLHLRAAGATM